jgi:hypothetical protein
MIKVQILPSGDVTSPWLSDVREIEAALMAIATQARAAGRTQFVTLSPRRGFGLSLAVGSDETFLVFGGKNRHPMYCHSRGDTEAFEPMFVSYQGEVEMSTPRRLIVPMELGLRAVNEFIVAGERPACVTWEEMVS